jgi:ABC-type enterochelin transport system permease subunit
MAQYRTLPFFLNYTDKVDLIQKLLEIYSATTTHLTQRDIDLLTLCFLYDINAKDFKDRVISANLGIKTHQNVTTMFSRLKKKGLVIKHSVKNRKYLNPDLEKLKEAIEMHPNIAIQMMYTKNDV